MTVTTDALIPALEDVRQAHVAVADLFRAEMTVTPVGRHRQTLERHVAEVHDHIAGIDDHVRDLRPRGMLQDTTDIARGLTKGAARVVALPLDVGALIAAGILRARPHASERQLLKNAEAEYAATARALAACRAGQTIAALAQDEEAEDLLASLRRQDEQLLQTLEYSVDEQARALAAAAAADRAKGDGGLAGTAVQAVRTAVDRLFEAAQSGGQQTARTAAGAAREMPDATRMAEEVQGAVTREEDLPVPGYGQLTVREITQRLRSLSQSDLTVVEGYERAHANRTGVLDSIEDLRGNQPWPDYDAMSPGQIHHRLRTVEPLLAREVLGYENKHRQRPDVIAAAQHRIGATV
jgi:hypothetical protein